MKRTKKQERETIEAYKDLTAWFSEEVTRKDMYEMFRYQMAFGEAESRIILSALSLVGAKWKAE